MALTKSERFVEIFMFVIGVFVGTVVTLGFMLRMTAMETAGHVTHEDPAVDSAIEERIMPAGQVVLMGSDELEAAAAAAAVNTAPVAAPLTGPQVYNASCFACHGAPGVGGAPVIGNADAWAARIAQGRELLIEHALNGFQGNAPTPMPPKGGRMDLSDEEIIAAVDYMLEQLEE